MVKNLYRCYLYIVYLALVDFAAVGLGRLLQVLFDQVPAFHGTTGGTSSGQEIVQALVFTIVSWAIAGSLGGLHFWLIRRDMRTDPVAAKGGAVRAFFLNVTLFLIVWTITPITVFALFPLLGKDANISGQLGSIVAGLMVLVLLEWDRQRFPAESGAALVFQRLHFYGIQLSLLGFFIVTWFMFASTFLLFITNNLLHIPVANPNCYESCTNLPAGDVWRTFGSVAWVTVFWLGYGWITRKDSAALLRHLAHFLSLAVGFGVCIWGLKLLLEVVWLAVAGQPVALYQVLDQSGSNNFSAFLTAGLLVLGVYVWWMRYVVRSGAIQRSTLLLIGEAILTVSLAVAFWWGVGLLLYSAMELWFAAANIAMTTWASAWAVMLAGIAYLPLDFLLYRRTVQSDISAPRRGLLFALLGSGTVALAIGASVALYAVGTSALGSPLDNWQQVARSGLAAFLVGVVVVGFYLWRFRTEFPASLARKVPDATPGPSTPATGTAGFDTPEAILDAFQTGKIDRTETLAQLQKLWTAGSPPPEVPAEASPVPPAETLAPESDNQPEQTNNEPPTRPLLTP